jgi:hypothetical protein
MTEAIDVWRTLLAFMLTVCGTYMIFIYKGLKHANSEFTEEVGIFSVASLLGGLTFFLEVLLRL